MKKQIVLVFILLTVFGMFVSNQNTSASVSEKSENQRNNADQYKIKTLIDTKEKQLAVTSAKEWIKDDRVIEYPITSDSVQWKKFTTHKQMVEACTIPDEIIEKLSTQELIGMIMDYPLLCDLYYYDTYEQGLYTLVSQFNGLRELLRRKDGISELIKYYKSYDIPKEPLISKKVTDELNDTNNEMYDKKLAGILKNGAKADALQTDFKVIANVELLEVLLTNDIVLDSSSQKQKEEILDIALEKYSKKIESDLFTGKENTFYRVVKENDSMNIFVNLQTKTTKLGALRNATLRSMNYVTTPKGSKVPVFTSAYYGDSWAKELDLKTKQQYPNATILSSSDNRYNCHSHAWYNQLPTNIYWMNHPDAYINDGSYKKITNKSNRGAHNRVLWMQVPLANPIIHSGYLVNINSDGTYKINSKWGQGPLMTHKAKYSPYSGGREYYKRN